MRRYLLTATVVLGVCCSARIAWTLDVEVSPRVVSEIQRFVEDRYNGAQAIASVEGTIFQKQERRIFGYNVRTVSVADTTSGKYFGVSIKGDDWEVWQKSSWIELQNHSCESRVAVMDSVSVDLARSLVEIVLPDLEEGELVSSVKSRRVRKYHPKYGEDPRTHTHEIMTGFEAPRCYEGRIFRAVVTPDTVVIEGVSGWVF